MPTDSAAAVDPGGAQGQEGDHISGPAGTVGQGEGPVAQEHGALLGGKGLAVRQIPEIGQLPVDHIIDRLQVHEAKLAQEGAQLFGASQLLGGAPEELG